VKQLDLDAGIAAVIDLVREVHTPIDQAITVGKPIAPFEYAALTGAVGALLDAIDARLTPPPALALKAVA
jgi:hypothetical protein